MSSLLRLTKRTWWWSVVNTEFRAPFVAPAYQMHAQPRPPCLARRPAARNAAGRLLATPPHAAAAPPLPPPAAHARQARAALLERLALTPERGIFGLPVRQSQAFAHSPPHSLAPCALPGGSARRD